MCVYENVCAFMYMCICVYMKMCVHLCMCVYMCNKVERSQQENMYLTLVDNDQNDLERIKETAVSNWHKIKG